MQTKNKMVMTDTMPRNTTYGWMDNQENDAQNF